MEDNEDDLGMNIQLSDVHDDTDVSDARRSQVERSVSRRKALYGMPKKRTRMPLRAAECLQTILSVFAADLVELKIESEVGQSRLAISRNSCERVRGMAPNANLHLGSFSGLKMLFM